MERSVNGYKTKYFHVCGASRANFDQMKKDGVSTKLLKKFLQLEDSFLKGEVLSICIHRKGIKGFQADIVKNMKKISSEIKKSFKKYGPFTYHNIHLKQASTPSKSINPAAQNSKSCSKLLN